MIAFDKYGIIIFAIYHRKNKYDLIRNVLALFVM